MVNTPQPVHRTGPLVPARTPLPAPNGPGAPPTEPVPHAPGAPGRTDLAAGPACPPAGTGYRVQHRDSGGADRGPTRLHKLRSGGLDGGLQASCPGYHGAQAIQTNGPHAAGVHCRGRHHATRGGVASATAASSPLPRHTAPPAGCNTQTDGTPQGGAAVRRHGGATGRRRGEFRPPPRPSADRRKHTRAAARHAPPVARQLPRAHSRQGRR